MRTVLVGEKGYVVAELERPEPGPGEIVVKMLSCGLCGTDVEKLEGRYRGSKPVIGHEAAGIVAGLGEGVEGLREGELVVPHHHVNCGSCYYCLKGSPTMCPSYREYNFKPGGFSEYFAVPRWIVERGGIHRSPPGLSAHEACLAEPTACVLRALKRIRQSNPSSYAVVGLGAVGLTFIQLAKWLGADIVIGIDINAARVAAAERYGAIGLQAEERDVSAEVMKHTEGRGVDAAIVAAGSPVALSRAISITRRGGTVCLFAVPPYGSTLNHDLSDLIVREISIITSNASTDRDMGEALQLLAQRIVDARGMITHLYPIEEFGKALQTFKSGAGIKVLITP
jgi:L-iditol 2-dehydrogenase